jgi:acetyl esterase/lipase
VVSIEAQTEIDRLFAERAAAAWLSVTSHIWPGLWHVLHTAAPTVPEACAAIEEIGVFVPGVFAG